MRAALVAIGCLVLGVCLLGWTIRGLLKGELRYRFWRYNRKSRPLQFWCAVAWGIGAGAVFALGGLAMLCLGGIRKLL